MVKVELKQVLPGGSSGGTGSTTGSDPGAASQPGTSSPGAPINVGNVGGPGSSTYQ